MHGTVLTSCMQVKVMSSYNIVSLCSRGGGGIFTRGGEVFLGNPLWGECLSLGYSLPRRKFPGEVLSCDTGFNGQSPPPQLLHVVEEYENL